MCQEKCRSFTKHIFFVTVPFRARFSCLRVTQIKETYMESLLFSRGVTQRDDEQHTAPVFKEFIFWVQFSHPGICKSMENQNRSRALGCINLSERICIFPLHEIAHSFADQIYGCEFFPHSAYLLEFILYQKLYSYSLLQSIVSYGYD